MVENPSAMQETGVGSLGQEGPLEKGMATHSSILAWRIPWTEEPGGLHSLWYRKELDTTERCTTICFSEFSCPAVSGSINDPHRNQLMFAGCTVMSHFLFFFLLSVFKW